MYLQELVEKNKNFKGSRAKNPNIHCNYNYEKTNKEQKQEKKRII